MKKLVIFSAAAALTIATVAGCSGRQRETATDVAKDSEAVTAAEQTTGTKTEVPGTTAEAAEVAAEADKENYDTGDTSKDNARNQDGIDENELLIVSFGTSYNDSRRLTIGTIEDAVEKIFSDSAVRRGFTGQIITDHVRSRDDAVTDNIGEAFDRAEKNGVRNLVTQPTHLMSGLKYTGLVNEATEYSDASNEVTIGKPPLTTEGDFRAVMRAVTKATAQYDDDETAICFMGHGTEAESDQVYAKMQDMLIGAGYKNYYAGTVEAAPSLDDVLVAMEEGSYKKVVLESPMIVAGDHANNDMIGDGEGFWKTVLEGVGCKVTRLVNGLGQLEAAQRLFIKHAQAVVDSLTK